MELSWFYHSRLVKIESDFKILLLLLFQNFIVIILGVVTALTN